MRTRTFNRPPGRVQPLVNLSFALPWGSAAVGGAAGTGAGRGASQTSVRAPSELQPLPIFSRWPVMKPPRPLPRYMKSRPSASRAMMSGRPSPLKSPPAKSAVKPPQPLPICSRWPVMKPPRPLPR